MNFPNTILFNGQKYYNAEEVQQYDPCFFTKVYKHIRNIIKNKNLTADDYMYAYLNKKGDWIASIESYARAKLMLKSEWVENNVPKVIVHMRTVGEPRIQQSLRPQTPPLNFEDETITEQQVSLKDRNLKEGSQMNVVPLEELYDCPPAPDLLELKNCEKFVDCNNHVLDIEVRGQREPDKCYFKVKDVSTAFYMPNLYIVLTNNSNKYVNGTHYTYFTSKILTNHCEIVSRKELYLTYQGMLKVLFSSRTGNAESFQKWASAKLFTVQMGTIDQKQKLSSRLLGVSTDTVKSMCSKSSASISCIYLFSLGTVQQLRLTFNIPSKYEDDMLLVKYGRTEDLERRTNEHEKDYGKIEGVELRLLKYTHIDSQYISDAECDINHFLTHSNSKYDFPNRSELAIISKDKLKQVEKEYEKIRKIYAGSLNEIIHDKDKLINEMHTLKLTHKLEIMEKDIIIRECKHTNALKDKDIELLQLKLMLAEKKHA